MNNLSELVVDDDSDDCSSFASTNKPNENRDNFKKKPFALSLGTSRKQTLIMMNKTKRKTKSANPIGM